MSHVNFSINGRQYRMACEDGQEAHLLKLAKDLDSRIGQLRSRFGEIGDMRLIVMAALTISDELAEARQELQHAQDELGSMRHAGESAAERTKATQSAISNALVAAAERIEKATRSLNQSLGNGVAIG